MYDVTFCLGIDGNGILIVLISLQDMIFGIETALAFI